MLLISTAALGESYPRGCEVTGFGYNENYLILNEQGEQTFYLIQNRSDTQIELERHETEEVFMSPTLQTKLDPKQWAAFASDVGNLHFKCYKHNDGNTSLVKCSDVLDICQYPRVKFALSNMGNYWVSTNKPQARVIKDAIAKGILLRW
nr:enhanced entry protein EnhB [Legionella impletisoli]